MLGEQDGEVCAVQAGHQVTSQQPTKTGVVGYINERSWGRPQRLR